MLGIIGGSGWSDFDGFDIVERRSFASSWGEPAAALAFAEFAEGEQRSARFCFLPRHGTEHRLPPHGINYRANVDALSQAGVDSVIALHAVGACNTQWGPGALVLPDQLIDYSYGREHSFFDALEDFSGHVDFTEPLASSWRQRLVACAEEAGLVLHDGGTYGCTQGPRFETAAEIRRMQRDGCDLAGMTLMPEAALCRERGIEYLSISMVVNPAAGVSGAPISLADIEAALVSARGRALELLKQVLLKQALLAGE